MWRRGPMHFVIGASFIALKTSTATGVATALPDVARRRNRRNERMEISNAKKSTRSLRRERAAACAAGQPGRRRTALIRCWCGFSSPVGARSAAFVQLKIANVRRCNGSSPRTPQRRSRLGTTAARAGQCQRSFRSSGVKAMASGPMSNRFAPAPTVPASQASTPCARAISIHRDASCSETNSAKPAPMLSVL